MTSWHFDGIAARRGHCLWISRLPQESAWPSRNHTPEDPAAAYLSNLLSGALGF